MKKILVPTDYSDNAGNALNFAINIAAQLNAKIYLVHIAKELVLPPYVFGEKYEALLAAEQEKNDAELQDYKITYFNPLNEGLGPVVCETVSKMGDVIETLEQLVNELEIDLLVMGTKGASGLKKVIMGSNTAEIIKKMICPVLAVPEAANFQGFGTVVFATDYNNMNPHQSLIPLAELSRNFNSEVLIFYIKSSRTVIDFTEMENSKQEISEILAASNHSFHIYQQEDLVNGINEITDTYNASMLVLIPKKHDLFERIFSRDITIEMAYQTNVPLLSLPAAKVL